MADNGNCSVKRLCFLSDPLCHLGFEGAQHRQTLRPSSSRGPQQSPASFRITVKDLEDDHIRPPYEAGSSIPRWARSGSCRSTADLGSGRERARAHLGSLKHPKRTSLYLLYTSLCSGELNAIRKCFICSPFHGRACRWATSFRFFRFFELPA